MHGRDGMDEVSTGAVTDTVEVLDGVVRTARSTRRPSASPPRRTGSSPAAMRPTTPTCCARCSAGRAGPARDVVVLNAAAAISWPGGPTTLEAAVTVAEASIDEGAARERSTPSSPRPGAWAARA